MSRLPARVLVVRQVPVPELPAGADCSSGTGGARLRGPERAGRAPGRAGTPVDGRFRRPPRPPPGHFRRRLQEPGGRGAAGSRTRSREGRGGGTSLSRAPRGHGAGRPGRGAGGAARAAAGRAGAAAGGGGLRPGGLRRVGAAAAARLPPSAAAAAGAGRRRAGTGCRWGGTPAPREEAPEAAPRAPSPPRRGTRVCGPSPACLLAQVPYVGASERQVEHALSLLRGRPGKMVDLGSGDGRIVRSACRGGPLASSPPHLLVPTVSCARRCWPPTGVVSTRLWATS